MKENYRIGARAESRNINSATPSVVVGSGIAGAAFSLRQIASACCGGASDVAHFGLRCESGSEACASAACSISRSTHMATRDATERLSNSAIALSCACLELASGNVTLIFELTDFETDIQANLD